MKKFIYSAMAVAMLATTSCKDDFAETFVGDQATVEFSISTPEIGTRAESFSKGTLATHLQYAVYDDKGNHLPELNGTTTLTNGQATISLQLKNNKTYNMLFWASTPDNTFYTVHLDDKMLTVNYDDALCNDETRDAFYCYDHFTVEGNITVPVQLKRPFAQLNIGAGDFTQSANSGYTPTKSYVKVPAYSTLNFADGSVDGQDVREFALNTIPVDEDFPYDPDITDAVKPYRYLAMNYILVGADQELVDIEFGHSNDNEGDTRTIGSVPVQRNYRTNIYGNILTSATDINVQIVPDYTGENNEKAPEYVNVATAQDLIDAVNDNEAPDNLVVTLTDNIDLNDLFGPNQAPTRAGNADPTLTIAAGKNLTLDLNGKKLSATSKQTGKNYDMIDVRGILTVKNGTIEYKHEGANMVWDASTNIFNVTAGGVLNIEKVTAKNLGGSDMAFVAHLNNWGEVTLNVENSTLESNYVAVRVFNSGYDMNNVTIKNSTLKGGNYAFWVHNYTKEDFSGDQGKANAQKALLNFDIFNGTNTFVGKNDTPIRLGMTNAVYLNANVSTVAGLQPLLAQGMNVTLANDLTINEGITAPYGNKTALSHKGGVFNGNGKTISATMGGDNYAVMTNGGTIKNLTIDNGFRGIVIMSATQTINLENVVSSGDGVCYALNTAEGTSTQDLVAKNCTFNGWSSWSLLKSATFTGCTFGQGTYYRNVYGRLGKPYVNTLFDSCNFCSKYYIDLSALGEGQTVTLKNCTVNGVKITAENWTSLVAPEDTCGEGQISVELKDGTYLTADNLADYIIFE